MSDNSGFGYHNRRKKADLISNMSLVLNIASWVFVVAVWILVEQAAPPGEGLVHARLGMGVTRTWWDEGFLTYAFILLILAFISSIGASIFNATRMRRKSDRFRKSTIISGTISFIAIIVFFIAFGSFIF